MIRSAFERFFGGFYHIRPDSWYIFVRRGLDPRKHHGYDCCAMQTGERTGGIELSCLSKVYVIGDYLTSVDGFVGYSIAMREGGFCNITNRQFVSWTADPVYPDYIFDRWGIRIEKVEDAVGLSGEPYLFTQEIHPDEKPPYGVSNWWEEN